MFVTKVWKDRLVEFSGRRKLKNVTTGEEMTVDVSRMEGAVSQTGDAFSAATMNDLEQRVKNEFDSINQSLNWILLKTITGTVETSVDFTKYKELRIVVTCDYGIISAEIPTNILNNTEQYLTGGGFAKGTYGAYSQTVLTQNKIKPFSFYVNSVLKTNMITKLYVR